MAQWLTNRTRNHEVAGSIPALAHVWRCHELWCRSQQTRSDPVLLWLWRRPVAATTIRSLAWESPYAVGAAQRNSKKRQKKKRIQLLLLYLKSLEFIEFM